MAIYHFRGTMISRNQGRSAVASAAYRAGEKLYDERYETLHDYSKKHDVVHNEIRRGSNLGSRFEAVFHEYPVKK